MAYYRHTGNPSQWKKALAWSLGVYVALILIFYFVYIKTQINSQEEFFGGGIEINYGTVEEGAGTDYTSIDQVSAAPEANRRPPVKEQEASVASPDPSQAEERRILTDDQGPEDVPTVKSSTNPDIEPKPLENPVTSNDHSRPEKEKEPVLNENALYKGTPSKGEGRGDGTGEQAGNQGAPTGNNLSDSYEGTGSGGGGVALNLSGRWFITRPGIKDDGQSTGKIAVQIAVNRNGDVVEAKAGARGTTISSPSLWRKCEQAVKAAKLNAISEGPEMQTGVITFTFILQ